MDIVYDNEKGVAAFMPAPCWQRLRTRLHAALVAPFGGGLPVLAASLLKGFFEGLTCVANVFRKQLARRPRIPLPTEFQDRMVFLIGARDPMSEVQLQARVSLAVVVNFANDRHEVGPVRSRVKNRMELPVQPSPRGNVIVAAKLLDVLPQDSISTGEVFLGEVGNREFQNFRLEQSSNTKQFLDVFGRQSRNNRSAVRKNSDQALGIELPQCFPDRNSADLELIRYGVLPQLGALRYNTPDNLVS